MKMEMLRTFVAVVDAGSFVGAAELVSLTPSAVSLQIKQVEQYFGRSLFDRSKATAVPTPFGLETATVVREAMLSVEALRQRRVRRVYGSIRLGLIHSVLVSVAPIALQRLRNEYPELDVKISSLTSPLMLDEIKAGTLDAAVVVRPSDGGSTRLHWRDFARQAFVLIAPPGSRSRTPVDALNTHGWIRYSRKIVGGRIAANFVRKTAPGAKVVAEIESTDAIVAMVSGGLGASVIPRPRLNLREAYALREMDLGESAPSRQLAFCCADVNCDSHNFEAVVRAFQDAYTRQS